MPSSKPRMMITIDRETRSVLQRLSAASKKPAATFVAEILQEARPMLESMAAAMEHAKTHRVEAFDQLGDALAQVQLSNAQVQLELREQTKAARAKKEGLAQKPMKKAKGGKRASAR